MKGIYLPCLREELSPVSSEHNEKPAGSIADVEKKLAFAKEYIDSSFTNFSFMKDYHSLHGKLLRNFSFDELCKMKYSSIFTMHSVIEDMFSKQLQHEVVRKIMSSMWRHGYGRGTWNEIVTAYDCIRKFSHVLGNDFAFQLDYTTGYNECGYTKFTRTFIDGVFGLLVYYKRKHVMTIGFSIMEHSRILIQQVQLKQRSGNRWLYKLPTNRLEFIIELFAKNFSNYELFLVDGNALVAKTMQNYQQRLEAVREHVAEYQKQLACSTSASVRKMYKRSIKLHQDDIDMLTACILHLNSSAERIESLYKDSGAFARTTPLTVGKMLYHQLYNPNHGINNQVDTILCA